MNHWYLSEGHYDDDHLSSEVTWGHIETAY